VLVEDGADEGGFRWVWFIVKFKFLRRNLRENAYVDFVLIVDDSSKRKVTSSSLIMWNSARVNCASCRHTTTTPAGLR
jgi:hypothetical protein